MPDGSITFSTRLDNTQLEKDYARAIKKVDSLEKKLAKLRQKRNEANERFIFGADELDDEWAKLKQIETELREVRSIVRDTSFTPDARADAKEQIAVVNERVQEQRQRVNMLQSEWNKVAASVERYDAQIKETTAELTRQETEAGALVEKIHAADGASEAMGRAVDRASTYLGKFTNRIKKLAARIFVFTLITKALQSMRTWFGNVIKSNDQARAAVARLKGALLTLVQPLVEVIIPAFTVLVDILTRLVTAAADLVARLFGTTIEESAKAAESFYDEQQAIDGVGDAAKKTKKALSGLDEINRVSGESADGVSNGAASGIEPDFKGFIKGKLTEIEFLMGTALLAVGAILTFSGANIPVGLGLMAAGAVAILSSTRENWGAIEKMLQGPVGGIFALVSGALLVVGAVLAFSGINIPLGIAMMALGAAGLATVAYINWDTVENALRGPVGDVVFLVSTALLAVGAVLAFSGANIPLGLGLMAAGAAGLAATLSVNWETVLTELRGPVGGVTALMSGALLALGAILAFSGAALPLGIGLIAAGAIGLAAAACVNWDTIEDALQGPVGAVAVIVGAALLVLGAILAFSGAALPLGIGLIAAGAIGLAEAAMLDWDSLPNKTRSVITTILLIVGAAAIVIGIILLFTGVAAPLGVGLILSGAGALGTALVLNWDFLKQKLMGAWESIQKWWNTEVAKYFTAEYWKTVGKNIVDWFFQGLTTGKWSSIASWFNVFFGEFAGGRGGSTSAGGGRYSSYSASMPDYQISSIPIPALATGAVIPPNREFLAVLGDQKSGTNLETPEALLRKIVREETGGVQKGGGNYRFTAQINRRVLFDEMLTEAQLRQLRTGRNPFELA